MAVRLGGETFRTASVSERTFGTSRVRSRCGSAGYLDDIWGEGRQSQRPAFSMCSIRLSTSSSASDPMLTAPAYGWSIAATRNSTNPIEAT